jgi:hypothetical protein
MAKLKYNRIKEITINDHRTGYDNKIYIYKSGDKFCLNSSYSNTNQNIAKLLNTTTRKFTNYVKKNYNATMRVNSFDTDRNLMFENETDAINCFDYIECNLVTLKLINEI